jgi:hypothetical protein
VGGNKPTQERSEWVKRILVQMALLSCTPRERLVLFSEGRSTRGYFESDTSKTRDFPSRHFAGVLYAPFTGSMGFILCELCECLE